MLLLADWLAVRMRNAFAPMAENMGLATGPARRASGYSERGCGMPASSARTSVSRYRR